MLTPIREAFKIIIAFVAAFKPGAALIRLARSHPAELVQIYICVKIHFIHVITSPEAVLFRCFLTDIVIICIRSECRPCKRQTVNLAQI